MNILFLNHSCNRTGAPMVILYFLDWLKNNHPNIKFDVLSFGEGSLEKDFTLVANKHTMVYKNRPYIFRIIRFVLRKTGLLKQHKSLLYNYELKRLAKANYDMIYVNTVVNIDVAVDIKKNHPKIKIILHAHELEATIQNYAPNLSKISKHIDKTIAASNLVKENLINNRNFDENTVETIYEFSKFESNSITNNDVSKTIKIGGAGLASRRKGIDSFILACSIIKKRAPEVDFEFLWMGKILEADKVEYLEDIRKLEIEKEFSFLGEILNPDWFFNNVDFFWMTSREDPFPLVCIEAAHYRVPILLFDKATGTQEIFPDLDYLISPYLDSYSLAKNTLFLAKNKQLYDETIDILEKRFSDLTIENQSQEIWNQIILTLNQG